MQTKTLTLAAALTLALSGAALNAHVSTGGPDGEDRPLKPDESPTLR